LGIDSIKKKNITISDTINALFLTADKLYASEQLELTTASFLV